jgi:hypothetical protein
MMSLIATSGLAFVVLVLHLPKVPPAPPRPTSKPD